MEGIREVLALPPSGDPLSGNNTVYIDGLAHDVDLGTL